MDARPRMRGRLALTFRKDDPETPVMVYLHQGRERATATYFCAVEAGDIEGFVLTEDEQRWLEASRADAEEWYAKYRVVEA